MCAVSWLTFCSTYRDRLSNFINESRGKKGKISRRVAVNAPFWTASCRGAGRWGRGREGYAPFQFLADQLTLFQLGGQIRPTTLILPPPHICGPSAASSRKRLQMTQSALMAILFISDTYLINFAVFFFLFYRKICFKPSIQTSQTISFTNNTKWKFDQSYEIDSCALIHSCLLFINLNFATS